MLKKFGETNFFSLSSKSFNKLMLYYPEKRRIGVKNHGRRRNVKTTSGSDKQVTADEDATSDDNSAEATS